MPENQRLFIAVPIPEEFRARMGNHVYGCDDCLAACPWNKFAAAAQANRAFIGRAELAAPAYAPDDMREDEAYILKKLDITPEQWAAEMKKPPAPEGAYFSQAGLYKLAHRLLGMGGLDRFKSRNVHPVDPAEAAKP